MAHSRTIQQNSMIFKAEACNSRASKRSWRNSNRPRENDDTSLGFFSFTRHILTDALLEAKLICKMRKKNKKKKVNASSRGKALNFKEQKIKHLLLSAKVTRKRKCELTPLSTKCPPQSRSLLSREMLMPSPELPRAHSRPR